MFAQIRTGITDEDAEKPEIPNGVRARGEQGIQRVRVRKDKERKNVSKEKVKRGRKGTQLYDIFPQECIILLFFYSWVHHPPRIRSWLSLFHKIS